MEMEDLGELANITGKDVKRFSLNGEKVWAKVVQVYDGDTCDLAFYFEGNILRFMCRLADIDATELDEEDEQGRDGEIARDFLAWLCIGIEAAKFPAEADAWTKKELQRELDQNKKLVYAIFEDFDKYGRPLVTIKSSPKKRKSFNDYLVDYGYAEQYCT